VVALIVALAALGACTDDGSGTSAGSSTPVATAAGSVAADTAAPTTTAPATAAPTTSAPTTTVPDPLALTEDPAALDAALACQGDTAASSTVLLVHGTGSTPDESFGSGFLRTLPGEGYRVCTVALPGRAVGDIQTSAQYVVAAVRALRQERNQQVAIVGHSQGVLVSRWAIAQYPDVAADTSMLIAIAGPNAGAPVIDGLCAQGCAAALWQMRVGSAFLAALDDAWAGVDVPVTAIRSTTDEFVPADSAASIGGAVVTIQDVCPDRAVTHAGLLADSVAYAAVLDALANGGTADRADLSADLCTQPTPAGMDAEALAAAGNAAFGAVLAAPPVTSEPPVVLPG